MSTSVRRILLLAIAGGVLVDLLVPGNAAGINAPLVVGALLAAAVVVAGRDGLARMDPADAWLGPVALVLAGMAAIRADDWLVTADLLLAAALATGAIACLAGGRITRGVVPAILDVSVGAVAAAGVGAGSVVARGRRERPAGDGTAHGWLRTRIGGAAPVARGLVIALPVGALFVALFASADAVFARLASDALAWQPDLDLVDLAGRAVVVGVVAWGAAGLLGLAGGLLPAFAPGMRGEARPPEAQGSPDGPPAAPGWGPAWVAAAPPTTPAPRPPLRFGAVEAATILVVLDVLFAGFVVLQLAYLFGGRDTLAIAGLTYAEYARRGFFELVAVAVLAGLLVVTLDVVAERRSRALLGAALVLLGLTALVLVSALVRLRLYQEAYGWTELRFVVLAAILWLGAALAIAAVLLIRRRTPWILHALGILALATVAGMNLIGPQALVATLNLERAIDPSLVPPGGRTGLDGAYLWELGDEAVVPIVAAWPRLGAADRAMLVPVLQERRVHLAHDPSVRGWPAWNLTRERARDALLAWEAARGTASR